MTCLSEPTHEDIILLRASINYTEFHLINGKKLISSYHLSYHENQIKGFLRINKSYLINPSYIEKIKAFGRRKEVQLKNGECISVSRRRRRVLESL
ncbi:LytTR family transcriptional regulator DNA-binding domain-containing protein [Emticicia sp. SJ17W-69]|uniref:LytTR family transcriptional regulator DNA-binding domain-containing protein n=1 Tax=Emticicia sp. SJ17W-69 TaxID=3421657 RepID=UPI003EBBD4F0